jgi:hypothetical protein
VLNLFKTVEDTGLAQWVREDAFAFPLLEAIHVAAVMMVAGTIALLDLRLLGLASGNRAVTRLSGEVLPWTWAGFLIAAVSGTMLMTGQAGAYAGNAQFRLKMALMAAAAVNMLVFHLVTWRRIGQWDHDVGPPAAARLAGALSLLLWIGVVVSGRWVGWTISASPF